MEFIRFVKKQFIYTLRGMEASFLYAKTEVDASVFWLMCEGIDS